MSQTTETKTKTPVGRLEEWIAALRSGKYKQGRYALRERGKYCCLGVMCDVYDSTRWQKLRFGADIFGTGGTAQTKTAPVEVREAYGISDWHMLSELVAMNDFEDRSFSEIADYIESTILPRVRREQEGQ